MLPENSNQARDYEPVVFLRCHSKNKDSADVQTQVWHCAFKPTLSDHEDDQFVVATCGGNSVCFINCSSGNVIAKYYTKDASILLFSLAWTTLRVRGQVKDILVAGGTKKSLYFIDFTKKSCILELSLKKSKARRNVSIQTLLFHQTDRQILFCGMNDGEICICELRAGSPESPELGLEVLSWLQNGAHELLDLAFCLTTRFLLAASHGGLTSHSFTSHSSLRAPHHLKNRVCIKVVGRSEGRSSEEGGLVDSVEVLKDGLMACKYALHSSIYICDLKPLRTKYDESRKLQEYTCPPLKVLQWCHTDNYFMYMGLSMEAELLGCGDDQGGLWLYDLKEVFEDSATCKEEALLSPKMILPWPVLTDHYNDKKRKLNLDIYDILIDKVAIHRSGAYLTVVTNNNLVCIWKRIS